jgi:hypothetical protein
LAQDLAGPRDDAGHTLLGRYTEGQYVYGAVDAQGAVPSLLACVWTGPVDAGLRRHGTGTLSMLVPAALLPPVHPGVAPSPCTAAPALAATFTRDRAVWGSLRTLILDDGAEALPGVSAGADADHPLVAGMGSGPNASPAASPTPAPAAITWTGAVTLVPLPADDASSADGLSDGDRDYLSLLPSRDLQDLLILVQAHPQAPSPPASPASLPLGRPCLALRAGPGSQQWPSGARYTGRASASALLPGALTHPRADTYVGELEDDTPVDVTALRHALSADFPACQAAPAFVDAARAFLAALGAARLPLRHGHGVLSSGNLSRRAFKGQFARGRRVSGVSVEDNGDTHIGAWDDEDRRAGAFLVCLPQRRWVCICEYAQDALVSTRIAYNVSVEDMDRLAQTEPSEVPNVDLAALAPGATDMQPFAATSDAEDAAALPVYDDEAAMLFTALTADNDARDGSVSVTGNGPLALSISAPLPLLLDDARTQRGWRYRAPAPDAQGQLARASYEGPVDGSMLPHGRGAVRTRPGRGVVATRFEGEFVHGVLEGTGEAWYAVPDRAPVDLPEHDDKAEAGEQEQEQEDESAVVLRACVEHFTGDFLRGHPARGRLTFSSASRARGQPYAAYEGALAAGIPHGQGVLEYAAGHRFEGEVARGVPVEGVFTHASGATFRGRMHGPTHTAALAAALLASLAPAAGSLQKLHAQPAPALALGAALAASPSDALALVLGDAAAAAKASPAPEQLALPLPLQGYSPLAAPDPALEALARQIVAATDEVAAADPDADGQDVLELVTRLLAAISPADVAPPLPPLAPSVRVRLNGAMITIAPAQTVALLASGVVTPAGQPQPEPDAEADAVDAKTILRVSGAEPSLAPRTVAALARDMQACVDAADDAIKQLQAQSAWPILPPVDRSPRLPRALCEQIAAIQQAGGTQALRDAHAALGSASESLFALTLSLRTALEQEQDEDRDCRRRFPRGWTPQEAAKITCRWWPDVEAAEQTHAQLKAQLAQLAAAPDAVRSGAVHVETPLQEAEKHIQDAEAASPACARALAELVLLRQAMAAVREACAGLFMAAAEHLDEQAAAALAGKPYEVSAAPSSGGSGGKKQRKQKKGGKSAPEADAEADADADASAALPAAVSERLATLRASLASATALAASASSAVSAHTRDAQRVRDRILADLRPVLERSVAEHQAAAAALASARELCAEMADNTRKAGEMVTRVVDGRRAERVERAQALLLDRLHAAVKRNDLTKALAVLSDSRSSVDETRAVDVLKYDANGFSALHLAVQRGLGAMLRLLVLFGASTLQRESRGRSALRLALDEKHPEMLPLLCELGYPVDRPEGAAAETALHTACAEADVSLAKLLIVLKADVNARTTARRTPLMLLCLRVRESAREAEEAVPVLAQVLAAHGANLNVVDDARNTAMHLLPASASSLRVLLTQLGARPHSIRNKHNEPLCPPSERARLGEVRARLLTMVPTTSALPLQPGAPLWVADNEATACQECELEFGWLARRHHCRMTGALLCAACSEHTVQSPSGAVRACAAAVNLLRTDLPAAGGDMHALLNEPHRRAAKGAGAVLEQEEGMVGDAEEEEFDWDRARAAARAHSPAVRGAEGPDDEDDLMGDLV